MSAAEPDAARYVAIVRCNVRHDGVSYAAGTRVQGPVARVLVGLGHATLDAAGAFEALTRKVETATAAAERDVRAAQEERRRAVEAASARARRARIKALNEAQQAPTLTYRRALDRELAAAGLGAASPPPGA